MPRPPLLPTENAWWVCSLPLILVLAFAPRLPAAAVITGDVTPVLPWSASTNPRIGNTGAGTLAVDAGSQVTSGFSDLGFNSGSTGTATITGAGSKWTSSTLRVGGSGSGSLVVEAGGQINNATGYLGGSSGSVGAATITGAGSTWANSSALYVGSLGTGNLTVANGGQVSAGTLYASLSDLHGDGTIAATGAVLDAELQLNAAQPSQAVFGFGAGGTLTVTPAAGGDLGAGYKGVGSLTISNGLAISSSGGYLGYHNGSTGTATVTGAGTTWTNSGDFTVGRSGSGALRVEAGGQVGNASAFFGNSSGSTGTATITGVGSKLINSSRLYVNNGEIHVEAGGQVSNTLGYLGYNAGSMGTATITGAESKWINSSTLYVGYNGSGSLTVEDEGHVGARTLYASAADLHGDGTIAVSTGAVLDADLQFNAAHPVQAVVGFGAGGTLTVTTGGGILGAGYRGPGSLTISEGVTVSSSTGYLGFRTGSAGLATITGAGSKWTTNAPIWVGDYGSGALRVEAGGQVSNTTGYMGNEFGSTGTATITGAGSTWTNSASLYVGSSGSGTLRVEAGGQISNEIGHLGYFAGSTGAATVTGAGSTWTNSSTLYLGTFGSASLHVEAGGRGSNDFGHLGHNSGSTGTATITGAGSKWTNSFVLYLGYTGRGQLHVEAGGLVSNTAGYMGYKSGSIGTATITGAGSKWFNSFGLYLGNSGSGTLRVEAGGHVINTAGYLGHLAGSTGTATITGAASKWTNGSMLYVGNFGSGALTITAGGLVGVRGTLTIDSNGGNDSFVNLATGGMLALWGNADDSLAQFLGLVAGTDAIRYWNTSLAGWTPLTSATLGVDYALQYQAAGDLTGYTLLTVLAAGPPGDFNSDGRVDGADLLAWQRGNSPTPNSPEDLATWRANFGLGAATPATTAVPEPGTIALAGLVLARLLLGCRSPHSRTV